MKNKKKLLDTNMGIVLLPVLFISRQPPKLYIPRDGSYMEVASLNWFYFFVFSIFAPLTFITMTHYLFHLYEFTCDFFIFSLFSSSNVHFPMLKIY